MTVVLQNGSARQLTPCELAELNGEAPAHSGRQSRPGHDRRRKSLLHGASRPSGSTPATRRGRAAASPPTGVPLQTFQRGWFEQYIKEGKNAIKWTRLSCRTFAANAVRLQLHVLAYNLGMCGRPLPRKRIPVLTLPGRVQNMCPAYSARHAWPLVLMRSADRVPINFAGFDAPPRFRVFSIPGHEPSIISSVHPSRSVDCCLAITPLQQSSNSYKPTFARFPAISLPRSLLWRD